MDDAMKKVIAIRTGRHCVFNLHMHLVFVTKYRQKVFSKEHLDFMQIIFNDVCVINKAQLIAFDGEVDHVHLLVNYPPQIAISKLVNSLKGVSSRLLRQQYSDITKYYYQNKALWSPSYFAASCGGAPLSIVKQYIEQQKTPE